MPVLLGPTASGKTAVAIPLALRLDAEIVSVDSRQIFRGMEVGSAAPSLEERGRVPHHLVADVDPREGMSAGEFGRRAVAVLRDIEARGKVALLVGGSGLYLRAALGGLDETHPGDAEVRRELRERLTHEGSRALWDELASRDPGTAASVSPADAVRITRALEILALTGEKPSALRRKGRVVESRERVAVLDRAREDLEKRIRMRVAAMIEAGLEDEVQRLLAAGLDASLPVMKSVGYAETIRYLRGEIDRTTWIESIAVNTRRFAKRQRTWFRGLEGAVWVTVGENEAPEAIAQRIADIWSQS